MEKISESELQRILKHIDQEELDYQYVDNGVFRPYLLAYDGTKYFLSKNEGSIILTHYDPKKDIPGKDGAYSHTVHNNILQILEAISFRDKSLYKCYWELTTNSIEVPFDAANYDENWYEEFTNTEGYSKEEDSICTYVVFESEEYQPEIISPWNTLGNEPYGGIIHESKPARLSKLRFEIHPVCTEPGRETYLFKVLCNDDEKLPEHICYKVMGKKGLKLIRKSVFEEMERFRIKIQK